jgi:Phage capsid scaffolding protein (GPO) serine peptidase
MAVKTIRTKPFLLATAGSTVDGRTIEDKHLEEMASSYNPKTYGARVNIEHIRGITPDAPFNAYGDLVELSTGEVEVDFNGKSEKRKALFGVFDFHDSAKALNEKGQKLYPSIEIQDNFGGKGFAYCMGVALTDSPAAIATERMQFSRTDPARINLSGDQAALIEFVEESTGSSEAADGFFSKLTEVLASFTGKAKTDPKDDPKGDDKAAAALDPAAFAALIEGIGQSFTAALKAQELAATKQIELLRAELTTVKSEIDKTPAGSFTARPLATGSDVGAATKTEF